jgi:sugar-specific transcriptional regulator TrmB
MFDTYLQDLGLSDKEAAIYIALLHVQHDSVANLAKMTDVNRTTVYPILASLAKKGLVTEVSLANKTRFRAESPERLEVYVENQRVLLDEQAKKLRDVIPQLKSIRRNVSERPVIKYYEGKEAVLSSMEDILEGEAEDGTMYMLYSRDLLDSIFTPADFKRYRGRRMARGLKTLAVYGHSEVIASEEGSRRVKINTEKYPIKCDISVVGDTVKISTLEGTVSSIVIKNADVAETVKSVIRFVSDSAKGKDDIS